MEINISEASPAIKQTIYSLFLGGDESIPIEGDTHLIESGICDSLSLVSLAAELENIFPGLSVQDQDITHENFGSIDSIIKFVLSYS